MTSFVKTDTILDKILAQKVLEVGEATRESDWLTQIEADARNAVPPRDFSAALHRHTVALIAEIKKASPSKGVLIADFDHRALARTYADNGAAAISILTDEVFFQGHLRYLREVGETVTIPTLRKDFIIHAYQVYEARAAGADAVLLIVMALEDAQLRDLQALIHDLGMAALVEVHNETELERALKLNARLIGVNNRDLRNFQEDLSTTERLAKLMPPSMTLVAESAIRSVEDVQRMGEAGAHAVLIGEGLITAPDRASAVRAFSSQTRVTQRESS